MTVLNREVNLSHVLNVVELAYIKYHYLLRALTVFLGGLLIGCVLFGWWLFPVQWVGSDPGQLQAPWGTVYVGLVADVYTLDLNLTRAADQLTYVGSLDDVCFAYRHEEDFAAALRLRALAYDVFEVDCEHH